MIYKLKKEVLLMDLEQVKDQDLKKMMNLDLETIIYQIHLLMYQVMLEGVETPENDFFFFI